MSDDDAATGASSGRTTVVDVTSIGITVISPFIPDSGWPGMLQRNSTIVIASGVVNVVSSVAPASACTNPEFGNVDVVRHNAQVDEPEGHGCARRDINRGWGEGKVSRFDLDGDVRIYRGHSVGIFTDSGR